jgi:hypothetical protein
MGGSFDVAALVRNLTDDPCEGHDLDSSRAAFPQGGRSGVRGRAARVDVVDEADVRGRGAGGSERTGDVAPAVGERQATLAGRWTRPPQERKHRYCPPLAELPGEALGRVVAASEAARSIGRDEREHAHLGWRDPVDHGLGGGRGKRAQAAFLPAADEAPD